MIELISKLLSLVLRHKPERLGITLDKNGWTDVSILLKKIKAKDVPSINLEVLKVVVSTNDKKRFEFDENFNKIRACQGHSVPIDLGLTPTEPPEILYHGSTGRSLNSIKDTGLDKRKRQHVHLSAQISTAFSVGSRHGKPIIFKIRAKDMHDAGFVFYLSANKVWLTDNVPASYIMFNEIIFE